MATRITDTFDRLDREGRPALVTYNMAGDPDYETSLDIMRALPEAGADVIELGMPFSDPMADGPAIQAAGLRALRGGQTLEKTLEMARRLPCRRRPHAHRVDGLLQSDLHLRSGTVHRGMRLPPGVDGLIMVDLPPEMDEELCLPALKAGLNFIRLATPTTDDARLAGGARQHIRVCLLCFHDRDHRFGASRHLEGRSRRDPDQGTHHVAGVRRLRRQDRRAGNGHRPIGGRRRGRVPRSSTPSPTAAPMRWNAYRQLVADLAEGVRKARLAAAE